MKWVTQKTLPPVLPVPGMEGATVSITQSSRSKRMSLRVSRVTGQVKLTLPPHVPLREAEAFVAQKAGWIAKHLGSIPVAPALATGETILLRGSPHQILPGSGRRVVAQNGELRVPGGADMISARIKAFLKLSAKQELTFATQKYASQLNVSFGRITIRDTRSRWGSCSSQGNLNYSWRLMMTPPAVLDYVAAHEVCHLIEMNHSHAFWDLVEGICPDYKTHKTWLRKYGDQVHAYRFD